MTRAEFETLMDQEGWSPLRRALWRGFTPLCDVETLRRELRRPDGLIQVKPVKEPRRSVIAWCCGFLRIAA